MASAPAVPGNGTVSAAGIDRASQGLIVVAGAGLAAILLLAPTIAPAQLGAMGVAAAGAIVAVASSSAIVWAAALTGAMCALALRWINVAPGRATFAAGRVAIPGAAALLAAAPFLPTTTVLTGARPVLAAGLLGCGVAALAGLLPLGGWTIGAVTTLSAADVGVWALLLAPAVLLDGIRLLTALPPLALAYFEGLLTVLGLGSAFWQAIQAHRLSGSARYARLVLADLALAAVAVGTGRAVQALPALLLIVLTHALAAPVLLQSREDQPRARRLTWLLLCGLPPAPSFWARLFVIEALTQVSFAGMIAALFVLLLLFMASALTALRPDADRPAPASHALPRAVADATGWALVAAGVAAGLAPGATLSLLFGVR